MRHLSSPDDCPICCQVWGVVTQPGIDPTRLTTRELASAVDRAPRTLRVHLTILVDAGRLDLDRRTPLPGARVGPRTQPLDQVTTPGQWAATVTLECPGCRRVLTVLAELAGADWTVRGSRQTELARYARMTPKTFKVHTQHLIDLELIRRETTAIVGAGGRYEGRRPDDYVLQSELMAPTGPPEVDPADVSGDWFTLAAGDLLAGVRWFCGPRLEPGDRKAAERRIAGHLRDGIPDSVLYRMLTRRQIDPVGIHSPFALLIALLPPPGARYVQPSAPITSRPACPTCGVIYADPDVPAGIECSSCAREHAPF